MVYTSEVGKVYIIDVKHSTHLIEFVNSLRMIQLCNRKLQIEVRSFYLTTEEKSIGWVHPN